MIGEVTFGVIGLLFLFADIRTFASTFQQTFFGAPNTDLAIMATAAFGTSFLALLVSWRLGPIRSLGTSGALFALATLLLTASRNNWVDLGLSVVALASGFWWLAFLHSARVPDSVSPLARALPIAFATDLALRAAFRTVAVPDLAWPVAFGIVLTGVLLYGASGLVTIAAPRRWTAPGLRGATGLFAVPSLILVAETGATNGAQAALAGGLGLGPDSLGATQVGALVLGIGLVAGAVVLWRGSPPGPIAALVVLAGASLLWVHLPFVSLVGASVLAAGAMLGAAALLGAPLHPARSPAGVVLALSLGWIAFVGFAFGFYALWALREALWAATALAIVAVALSRPAIRIGLPLASAIAALAILVPLSAVVVTPAVGQEPLRNTFRFMTYNIHQGYNAGQIPSFDELVSAISAESPDVVCLQEVVRGWMIDGQHDALAVIAERLGMRYAFIPNIGDLYGNAVLTRAPMSDVRSVHFAREPGLRHQPRGALFVKVGEPQTGQVLVMCTHLDDVSGASAVRQEQVRTILRAWDGTSPAVLAGDLNATPESPEIQLLDEAGFDDLGVTAGPTTTMNDPQIRIDYVWGHGVTGSQAHAPSAEEAMRASDHRWLVVNVTWGGR